MEKLGDGTAWQWLAPLLQMTDSAFPSGGYAHSLGLEELVRLRTLVGESGLHTALHDHFIPGMQWVELPYLRYAWEAGIGDLAELDWELSATRMAGELREASRKLGAQRLRSAARMIDSPELRELANALGAGRLAGNHAIVFGRIARASGVPCLAALQAYFYQGVSGPCFAALKLLRIGQDACQRALQRALSLSAQVVADSLDVEREAAGLFDPVLEIAGMRHAFADERLFIS